MTFLEGSFSGCGDVLHSLTLWGASTASTTAAAAPKGMLRFGSPSRWGSGSARRTAEALRSDLTGDGGRPALSTQGSSSLRRRASRGKTKNPHGVGGLKGWENVLVGFLHTYWWRQWGEWLRCRWRGTGSPRGYWGSEQQNQADSFRNTF